MPEASRHEADTVAAICARHGNQPALLIEMLHDIQEALGHVPDASLKTIAGALNLTRAEVHGVVSFYHDFRKEPAGNVIVKVCRAEACQSMGAEALLASIMRRYGEEAAAKVTVEPVYCLGNCALSPAAMVNGKLMGRVDEARISARVSEALAQ
jgi:formate dehydrogenase subunit gamma